MASVPLDASGGIRTGQSPALGGVAARFGNSHILNVKDYGAVGDGVTDDAAAFNAASAALPSSGGMLIVPPGTYIMGTSWNLNKSNVFVLGLGLPTLKVQAGSTSGVGLVSVSNASDVIIEGIQFDGNQANAVNFNNVCQTFQTTRCRWIRCRFTNMRGIALLMSNSTFTGPMYCDFNNCGTWNRTSLNNADRKQAAAWTGGSSDFNFALFNNFTSTGLDCVSSPGPHALVQGNTFNDFDSAAIYSNSVDRWRVLNNYVNAFPSVNSAAGSGIDMTGTKAIVANNTIESCMNAGLLIGGGSDHWVVTGNVCRNNYRGGTSTAKGGITFDTHVGATTTSDIVLSSNSCYDDQGAGSVTQRFAIGHNAGAGVLDLSIQIDESNLLRGYDVAGNPDPLSRFQTTKFGALHHAQAVSLAASGTMVLSPNTRQYILDVRQTTDNRSARVNVNNTALDKPYDAAAEFTLTDSGAVSVVYNDGTNIVLKNRAGVTKTYLFKLDMLEGVS